MNEEIGCEINNEFYPYYKFNFGSKYLEKWLDDINRKFKSINYKNDSYEIIEEAKYVSDAFVKTIITTIKAIHMNIRQIEENVERISHIKNKEKREYEYAIQYKRLCNCYDMIEEMAQGSNPESTYFNNIKFVMDDIDKKSLFTEAFKVCKTEIWHDMILGASSYIKTHFAFNEKYFYNLSKENQKKYLDTIDKMEKV